ncbi:hypothetical protein [Sanguibacter suarezii]|uniref:hypothetical protein n=1 Tax=Sanguibacter suarezii TaxID=60921 RepID=UPI0008341B8E|nr:hypothetical protein [Sanguibacter suarezii]
MKKRTVVRWGLGAVIATTALVGCGNDGIDGEPIESPGEATSADPDYVRGTPEGVSVPADAGAGAGWVADRERELWVMTISSSSNPLVATAATADGQTITITLEMADADGPATNDLAPTTSYVEVPDGVDVDSPVTVNLGELGTAEIMDPDNPGWLLDNS